MATTASLWNGHGMSPLACLDTPIRGPELGCCVHEPLVLAQPTGPAPPGGAARRAWASGLVHLQLVIFHPNQGPQVPSRLFLQARRARQLRLVGDGESGAPPSLGPGWLWGAVGAGGGWRFTESTGLC